VSIYAVVVGFLLLFPWSLVGIIVGGAAITALKRRLVGADPSRASGLSGCLCVPASAVERSSR
jgi:hypothetical protein